VPASTGALGSVDPAQTGNPALTDRVAEATPRRATAALAPVGFPIPKSLADALSGGGSFAGYSAVSTFLECPEKSRLRFLGIERRAREEYGVGMLGALAMGTVIHCLRAIRIAHGHEVALHVLHIVFGPDLHPEDILRLDFMFKVYESNFPEGTDPWRVIGIESEVVTDVALAGDVPALRSVRYDTVIQMRDGAILSWEAKSAARGGATSLDQYNPQAMCQQALWNKNTALVAQWGPMKGVLFDHLIKTETPKVDRIGPKYFSKPQQEMALAYLRLPDEGRFKVTAEGKYPRMLHACWGRFFACPYIAACHEQSYGDYVYKDGSRYEGE